MFSMDLFSIELVIVNYRRYLCYISFMLPLPATSWAEEVASSAAAVAAADKPAGITVDIFSDWVEDTEAAPLCRGVYVEPPWEWRPPEAGIGIEADSSEVHQGTVTVLRGDVVAQYRDQTLRANEAYVHRDPATGEFTVIEAFGDVELQQPGVRYLGEQAWYQFEPEHVHLGAGHFRFYEYNARGQADEMEVVSGEPIRLTRVRFTTCAPDDNNWEFRASALTLDREDGTGSARNARLYIKDVPVLYTPYAGFPIDDRRKTGFLLPSYRYSNRHGHSGSLPFYLNLAPHYDATITPSYYQKNGTRVETDARYLTANSQGDFGFDIIPYDDEAEDTRYAYYVEHDQRFNRHWRGSIDFSRSSDDSYLNDFSNSVSAYSTQQLNQQAKVEYRSRHWQNTVNVQAFQTLQPSDDEEFVDKQYQRLPQLLSMGDYRDGWLGLDYALRSEYVYFNINDDDKPTGHRIDVLGDVSLPWERPWAFVTPRVELQHTQYYNDDVLPEQDETIFRTLPRVSLDSGLFFDRDINWLGEGYQQTLEPRLYYLYVPFTNQDDIPVYDTAFRDISFAQLFRSNRFSGADRVGDANQVTLAITSRFLQAANGRERARVSVGQIIFFEDRDVTLEDEGKSDDRWSAYVSEAYYAFSPEWSIRGYMEFNPNDGDIDKGTVTLQYLPQQGSVVNVGYRFLEDDPGIRESVNQSDVSFMWPLFNRLRVLGRWNYDFDVERSVDLYGGLEYESCCWAVRALGRRYIRSFVETNSTFDDDKYDTAFYIQFQLKGLMSTPSSATRLLRDTMPGFYDIF